ncbi:TraB/GumN family protein [Sphingobacterium detergens]
MNIKRTFLFSLFFITFTIVYPQDKPKTLLWKVSKNGSENISYLFGTFHQVNPDFFDSLSIANLHLKNSEILFVEAYSDPNTDTTEAEQNKDAALFEAWNKEKWKSKLNSRQFVIFEKFVNSKWVDEYVYKLHPAQLMFLLQYMYIQGVCDTLNRSSYDPIDTRITQIGLEHKLTVIGLDKNQAQDIKISTEKDKSLSLKNTLKQDVIYIDYILKKNTDNPTAKILRDYKNKNLDYSLNKSIKGNSYLLNERNNKWMAQLTESFNTKNCFVAVGFRHLCYKTGLIQQLRREGYKVEPVAL